MYGNKTKEEMRARLEEFKRRKQQSKEISKAGLLKDATTTTDKLTTIVYLYYYKLKLESK